MTKPKHCDGCNQHHATYALWNFEDRPKVKRLCSRCKQKGFTFDFHGNVLNPKGQLVVFDSVEDHRFIASGSDKT